MPRQAITAVRSESTHASGTPVGATTALVVTLALGVTAACWVLAVRRMTGMDMGPATELGPFASFTGMWVAMMAAMMLPGAVPAVLRYVRGGGRAGGAALLVASYLAVWALVGIGLYAVYRPHGPVAAGSVVIAAGVYELTPLKRRFRRACRARLRSGFELGLCCAGASAGLMAVLAAVGVMSIAWMSLIAIVVLVQKLLPPNAALDLPLALALVGLGIWIAVAPGSQPLFTPPM